MTQSDPAETPPSASPEPASAPRPEKSEGPRRPRDLALSLAVLLVPIGLIVALFQFLGGDQEIVTVDPQPAIAQARDAGLSVAAPRGLSDDWKTTSAVIRTFGVATTLRIGYVTPTGGFAQVIQSNADPESLLRRELGGGKRPTGVERIGGAQWQAHPGRGQERALVLTEPERTILVLGKASAKELRALAASLR
ncbi:MAG: DUF4245 domain-containing protein [Dehalococcoidia bacterium]